MSTNFSLQATFLSENFPPQQNRCLMFLSIFLVVWNVYGGFGNKKHKTPRMGHALPLVSLCKALAQRGHQVTLAASSGSSAAVGWLVGWFGNQVTLDPADF